MVDKDNDPQVEDFEQGFVEYLTHNDEHHPDFEPATVVSLDLEWPDEVAVVKLALQQTQVLSNVVLGADAKRVLARLDNLLAD